MSSYAQLQEFFVATMTSVYAVRRAMNKVFVTKTYLRRNTESAKRIGTTFFSATDFLAITTAKGIFFYPVDMQPEDVPDFYRIRTEHTSRVLALSIAEEPAIKCVESQTDDTKDKRWLAHTKNVLRQIINDPVYRVSRDPLKGFDSDFFN